MTSTSTSEPKNRALVIHLGNHGVYFDTTTTLLTKVIATPTLQISFPTLTLAVNHVLQKGALTMNDETNNGVSSDSSYDMIHIILNLHELPTVWTSTMDLALLPLQNKVQNTIDNGNSNSSTSTLLVHLVQQEQLIQTPINLQMIHTSFLLAGLQCISEQKNEYSVPEHENTPAVETVDNHSTTSSSGTVGVVRTMMAQKIATSSASSSSSTAAAGSSSLLKAVPIPIKPMPSTKSITISLDDDDNDHNQNDLIDEDDLLQEEGLYNVAPPPSSSIGSTTSNKDDCGGRTACDDCTCGRKEQEEGLLSSSTAAVPRPPMSSACGKCGMGDAFRCASCPYLGKPAFKAGHEHLVLDLQDDL